MTELTRLPRRKVGRTDIEVTTLGLGGAWLGYIPSTDRRDEGLGAATVLRALDLGINLIDTSPLYGPSEKIIGRALAEFFRRGGKRRDIVVSTKTGTRTQPKDYSYDGTMRSVETSLSDLGLEYIDFMLVHDPDDLEPVFAPSGALEALLKLKDDGLVRSIGLGVRSHEFHRRCIENKHFDLSLTYSDYNLINQSAAESVLKPANEHNVGVFNAMVVEYGLLSGRNPQEVADERKQTLPVHKVERACEIWKWANEEHLDLLALAIQFSTRDKRIASTLVGVASPAEIENDFYVSQKVIPDSAWQTLTHLVSGS